jgi:hypothetical protein
VKEKGIQLSVNCKGRAIDGIFIRWLWMTIKYERPHMKVPDDGLQLYERLKEYLFTTVGGHINHSAINATELVSKKGIHCSPPIKIKQDFFSFVQSPIKSRN